MENSSTTVRYRGALAGFLGGSLYAIVCATLFTVLDKSSVNTFEFVSLAMLIGTPISAGVITVFFATKEQANNIHYRLVYPWLSILGWSAISLIFAWETYVCVVMLLPLFLPLASIGGYIGGLVRTHFCETTNHGAVSCFSVLPLIIVLIEIPIEPPTLIESVTTSVLINAPIEQVWRSLPNIDKIQTSELPWTLSHFLGIPKPLAALTDTLQEGGIRDIYWEKGIHFQEKITEVIENKMIAYDVFVDKESMKIAELDTHIVVGDKYFDVDAGRYFITSKNDNTVLSLTTTYRMTTNLNWYGKFWANYVLNDFHSSVLEMIRRRNEI